MSSLGQKIREIRQGLKLNQAQFADEVGVSQGTVSKWEKGEQVPETGPLIEIARLGETDAFTLMEFDQADRGKGPAPQRSTPSEPNAVVATDLPPPSARGGTRDLPMRGIAVMGDDGDFSFNGDVADYIPRPPSLLHKRKAFGVYATNDSMEPAYSDGDPVVIDPDRPPAIGDDVVIEMKPGPNGEPGACYLKRLVKRGPPTIVVKQFNPPKDIPFQSNEVLHVYRVVPRRELLGL